MHVADGGGEGAGGEFADAAKLSGATSLCVFGGMLLDALVAPFEVVIKLAPLELGLLQAQADDGGHFVGGVFEDVSKCNAKGVGALSELQAELAKQAADAVDASGAIFLVAPPVPI